VGGWKVGGRNGGVARGNGGVLSGDDIKAGKQECRNDIAYDTGI